MTCLRSEGLQTRTSRNTDGCNLLSCIYQSILHLISLISTDWLTLIHPTLPTPLISSSPAWTPLHTLIIYIYTQVYICTYIYTYTVYICIYRLIWIHTHTCTHTNSYIDTYTHMHSSYIHFTYTSNSVKYL